MELRHQESRKRGHVEDHLCLDIRRLLKEEIIVKGRTTSWVGYWGFLITIDANLEQAHDLVIRLSFQAKEQALRCQYGTDKLKRTRLFFVDDTGRNVEKIYLVGDRFVSRVVGGLAFRDQSKTKVGPRTLRHRVQWPLEHQLQSSLPDQKRTSVENELARVKRTLDFLLLGKVALRLEQRWRRREQRKHFRRRFRTAQLKMKQRVTITPEQILAGYTKLVEDLVEITPRMTRDMPVIQFTRSL